MRGRTSGAKHSANYGFASRDPVDDDRKTTCERPALAPPPGAWTVPPPPLENASTNSTRRRGRRKALATAFAGAEMHDLDFAHEHAAMTDCFKVFPVSDIARAEGTSV